MNYYCSHFNNQFNMLYSSLNLLFQCVIILDLTSRAVYSAVWTRVAANVSQACECSSVTFNWQYVSAYTTQSVQWELVTESTADVIANYAPAPGLFVAYGSLRNRLRFASPASLTVTSVTLTDPGVLLISILFSNNLDSIPPSAAVLASVTPLDLSRTNSTVVSVTDNSTSLILLGAPPVYRSSASFSLSCAWLQNGVVVLNSSVLVKAKVTGRGCSVSVYCYRCVVGTCTGQVDHVCRFITESCHSASTSLPLVASSSHSLPDVSANVGGPTCVVQWLVASLSIASTCLMAAMTVLIGLLSGQLQRLRQFEYDVTGGLRHEAALPRLH